MRFLSLTLLLSSALLLSACKDDSSQAGTEQPAPPAGCKIHCAP